MTREERERVWYIIWRSIVVLLCCVDKVQDREKVTSRCWIVMNIVIELNHGPSLGLAPYSSAPAGGFPWYIPKRLTHANANVCLYAGDPNNAECR